MNYGELISAVAKNTGKSKAVVKSVIAETVDTIVGQLHAEDKVFIRHLGVFSTILREERKSKSFGKDLIIPEHKGFHFKPSSFMKKVVNDKQ